MIHHTRILNKNIVYIIFSLLFLAPSLTLNVSKNSFYPPLLLNISHAIVFLRTRFTPSPFNLKNFFVLSLPSRYIFLRIRFTPSPNILPMSVTYIRLLPLYNHSLLLTVLTGSSLFNTLVLHRKKQHELLRADM